MTEATFRKLALALPGAEEKAHMGHPDFRVAGKVFASLRYPAKGWGMVQLTPFEQEVFVKSEPEIFVPVKGAWGLKGSTNVRLDPATETKVRDALIAAWRHRAQKQLVEELDRKRQRSDAKK